MKKIITLVLITVGLFVTACSNTGNTNTTQVSNIDAANSEVSVEEANEEEEMSGNKYMIIKLKTNPTTGFDFVCNMTGDSEAALILEDEILAPPKTDLLGAATYRDYVFSALEGTEGKVTLDFNYLRNWEGGENGFHIYYDLYVDENANITFLEKRGEKVSFDFNLDDYSDPIFTSEYSTQSTEYVEEPEE